MKIKLLLTLLLFITPLAKAQDFMDEIARQACDCVSKESQNSDPEKVKMMMGLCLIDAASPYSKQLKKKYGIDFDKIETQGEELGRIIGMKMASICPDVLILMAKTVSDDMPPPPPVAYNQKYGSASLTTEGKIVSITDDKFVEFSIKHADGKILKYYWFTYIDSDIDLSTEYKKLQESFVRITYQTKEYFDARIGEYRAFDVIQTIELLEE